MRFLVSLANPANSRTGSNNRVLDLVHPSLYPFHYGHSFLRDGTIAEAPKPDIKSYGETWSKAYQWLPTDFSVAEDGKVSIEGYMCISLFCLSPLSLVNS